MMMILGSLQSFYTTIAIDKWFLNILSKSTAILLYFYKMLLNTGNNCYNLQIIEVETALYIECFIRLSQYLCGHCRTPCRWSFLSLFCLLGCLLCSYESMMHGLAIICKKKNENLVLNCWQSLLPSRAQMFRVSCMQPPAEHFRSSSALCALCTIQTGLSYVRTHHEWEQPPHGVTQWIRLWRKCKCRDTLTNWNLFLSFISAGLYTPWKVIKNYSNSLIVNKSFKKIILKKKKNWKFIPFSQTCHAGSTLPKVNKYFAIEIWWRQQSTQLFPVA